MKENNVLTANRFQQRHRMPRETGGDTLQEGF